MQTTQRTFVFNALLFVVALLALGAAYAQTGAPSPEAPAALPNGINFSGAYTPDDVAYFQDDLERLHRDLPEWWQYVLDARPFTIVIDPRTARGAIVAVTECCDASGSGTVRFGYHLSEISTGSDPDSQSAEARRVAFLGMLAHELTHVRDLRAGRFTVKTDRKSCVDAETSGLSQQLAIKRDLAAGGAGGVTAWLTEQIRSENRDLHSRSFWDWYCAAFE